MIQMKDDNLSEEIKSDNENAFNKAFDLYYSRLCYFADTILHDFDLSRSTVQQVFVDLWIKREKIMVSSLQPYLYKSVHNAVLDVVRHKKVEALYLSSLDKNEPEEMIDLIEEAELADRINRAIQKLPEKCRQIFIMCRFEELKYSEIAQRLNISVKTVEMQIGIALKKIRKELSDYQIFNFFVLFYTKKYQNSYRVD
jgi:RNA polymerase sigma-70 factor, ECF subfamily